MKDGDIALGNAEIAGRERAVLIVAALAISILASAVYGNREIVFDAQKASTSLNTPNSGVVFDFSKLTNPQLALPALKGR